MSIKSCDLPNNLDKRIIEIISSSLPDKTHPLYFVDGGAAVNSPKGFLHCINIDTNRMFIFSRSDIARILDRNELNALRQLRFLEILREHTEKTLGKNPSEEICDKALQSLKEYGVIPENGKNVIPAGKYPPLVHDVNINGQIVAIKPSSLPPEYQSATRQLFRVEGGFGASANCRESTVLLINVYNGSLSICDRSDIMCVVPKNSLPSWIFSNLKKFDLVRQKKDKGYER